MKTALETAGNAAATLSASSVAMKRKLERARWAALGLAIVAAILGAVTTIVVETAPWRWAFAFATALALGLGPWLTAHFLGQNQATRWVAVRAAAEALKREVYRRAAKCKPYDGTAQEADLALIKEKQAIEADLGDVEEVAVESMDLPKAEIDLNTYVINRVDNQISWLRRRAGDHARQAAALRGAEIAVAFIGVVMSAAGAAFGETDQRQIPGALHRRGDHGVHRLDRPYRSRPLRLHRGDVPRHRQAPRKRAGIARPHNPAAGFRGQVRSHPVGGEQRLDGQIPEGIMGSIARSNDPMSPNKFFGRARRCSQQNIYKSIDLKNCLATIAGSAM